MRYMMSSLKAKHRTYAEDKKLNEIAAETRHDHYFDMTAHGRRVNAQNKRAKALTAAPNEHTPFQPA